MLYVFNVVTQNVFQGHGLVPITWTFLWILQRGYTNISLYCTNDEIPYQAYSRAWDHTIIEYIAANENCNFRISSVIVATPKPRNAEIHRPWPHRTIY